jgi:hypothetical protein
MTIRAIILRALSAIRPRHRVNGWYAGPIIGWKNYSRARLKPLADGVLQFDMSQGIDALCKSVGVLPATMTIRYELTGQVSPTDTIADPLISVCFQRKSDDWTARGDYQQYRWYAGEALLLKPGIGEFTIDFADGEWFDVLGQPRVKSNVLFAQAQLDVATIYITFGHSAGRSHGVAGQAQFKLLAVT